MWITQKNPVNTRVFAVDNSRFFVDNYVDNLKRFVENFVRKNRKKLST